MLNAMEQEGTGEQQFKSRTWASSTEIMIIKCIASQGQPPPRSTTLQCTCSFGSWHHLHLLSFPSPCKPPIQALIWEGKQRGAGGCRATPYFKVGAKTLLLKTEQGDTEKIPSGLSLHNHFLPSLPPQAEATLPCHTKLNFLFILQSNRCLHNTILRFNLIMILHITL